MAKIFIFSFGHSENPLKFRPFYAVHLRSGQARSEYPVCRLVSYTHAAHKAFLSREAKQLTKEADSQADKDKEKKKEKTQLAYAIPIVIQSVIE